MSWLKRPAIVSFVIVIAITMMAASAHANESFPSLTYPAPVPAVSGHALALCPSKAGLVGFDVTAVRRAREIAASYDRENLATDLRNADRDWWPQVRRMRRTGKPGTGVRFQVVLGSEATSKSGFAVFMGPACGKASQ